MATRATFRITDQRRAVVAGISIFNGRSHFRLSSESHIVSFRRAPDPTSLCSGGF